MVVERDILRTLLELQRELGFGVLFITHDLALLRSFCTHIGVLYGGHLVELGAVEDIGAHPYTRGLLDAIPPAIGEDREPTSIPGAPPRIDAMPPGCRFAPRCPLADTKCQERPPFVDGVACWKC